MVGDFNNKWHTWEDTGLLGRFQAVAITPEDAVTTTSVDGGGIIDYVVCDARTKDLILSVKIYDGAVPFHPHVGIVVIISARPRLLKAWKMINPKKN